MVAKEYDNPADGYNRLLAVVSLFHGDFSIDWLVDLLAGEKTSQILALLEEGVKDSYLINRQPGCYGFMDSKKQEKWRSRLSRDDEKQLHRQVADILMREMPEDERKACAVASHLLHISNDITRCQYLAKAGDLHLQAFRMEDALSCYSKVLEDLSTLRGEEEDRLFADTAIKYSKISTARHDTEQVLSIIHSAFERAKRWDMQRTQALLKMHMAKNEWLGSHYSNALKQFEEGWSLAERLNDPKLMQSATTFSTFFLFWQGRFREAVRVYEDSVPDIENYPRGGFPLLAIMTVGYCYAQIGQVSQGLGMLDAIRNQCLKKNNIYIASYSIGNIGNILLGIGRIEEAIRFYEIAIKQARQVHNDWVLNSTEICLAYANFLMGQKKQCLKYLREFLQRTQRVKTTVYFYPHLMELCLAMKKGDLPQVEGLSLEREIQAMMKGKNIFMKGLAHRYRAILKQMEGADQERIIADLKKSINRLEESGQQVELAKSRLELARCYLTMGREADAKTLTLTATKALAPLNEDLIPPDMRALIKDRPVGEKLLKEILNLGQEVVTIRENKDLVQHIISTVNRITGAERGAIFFLDGNKGHPGLILRAAKNLPSDHINIKHFTSSMQMIEEVAVSGKGRIMGSGAEENFEAFDHEMIRSRICVPMILRDKTVGVLYHDNRLLGSAFKESDLELLSYFAALAAFALDNASAYEEIQRLNRKLSEENLYYKEEHLENLHFEDIVGESSAIRSVLAQVDQVTGTDASVMIIGETGVGKELVARAIHRHSPRRDKPFIRVHCSALPESLIPSELFGHEKGAFTGANRRRIGRFELADGGTLFLDEIGDLSLDIQVRLLRVLQTREFERVGGSDTLSSDFRLVVATNRDLEEDVRIGKFRADLYYRLAVFPIHVPPLREREDDIPLLAYYFLKIYSKKQAKEFTKIPDPDMERLLQYDWPGNVRELENIIERGTILNTGPVFRVPELRTEHHDISPQKGGVTLRENERRHVLWALNKTGWKVRGAGGAAELLDLPASTLSFRMKRLEIRRPTKGTTFRGA